MVARSWLVSPLIHRDFRDRYLRVAGVNLASATLNHHTRYCWRSQFRRNQYAAKHDFQGRAEGKSGVHRTSLAVSVVVNQGWTAPLSTPGLPIRDARGP
jgi:hypothetical protein